jgi:hypothetical protein
VGGILMRRTMSKKTEEPMTLEQMELARARIDVMIGFLKNRTTERTDRKVAADIAQYQDWRDDLDVQIGLERIRLNTDHRRRRRPLGS